MALFARSIILLRKSDFTGKPSRTIMGLTTAYLVAAGRLEEFFDAIRRAQAPEKFTLTFLKDLGFTSSNERLFIGLLKGLGFLDEAGVPSQRYFDFLDGTRWQLILADAIREAYEDLFRLDRNAQALERDEIVGKLASLTRGQYSQSIIGHMAKTFESLCALANFDELPRVVEAATDTSNNELADRDGPLEQSEPIIAAEGVALSRALPSPEIGPSPRSEAPSLVYRIELVLPATRDKAVYDAVFRSLREHLQ
ncbi:MAG TPA: DUF5343 domain-containing protein [Lacipirellulaceae bacterium]|nr:DUF5343 domain-containing protein [Lacipirellulaceae bacterium]